MQFDVSEIGLQPRPFGLGLLNAVLAEDALAGLENGANVVGIEGFRDRDERHRCGIATGLTGGGGNAVADG
jgi:hypothetical protein